jgi:phage FluMu protein gp41
MRKVAEHDERPTVASSSSPAAGHELVARDVEHAEALDPPERLRQLAQLTINEAHALHRLPLISGR